MRRADLRSRRGLVRLNRADLNSNLSLGSFSRRKKHKTDIFGTDMNQIIQTINICFSIPIKMRRPA